jgi:hypothetical protein
MHKFVGLALLAALLLGARPQDTENQPARTRWGAYTVVVEKVGKEEFSPARARILDSKGRVVQEIQDQRFETVELVEMDGTPPAELHLSAFSGGAHCCSTDYWFTQKGGVRNLLIFDGGNEGISGMKDLNGDGRKEILAGNDCLAYFGDLSYAASPSSLTMILGWNGRKYTDQTRRYPAQAMKQIASYKQAFLDAKKAKPDIAQDMSRLGAAGYYGGMLTIGRGKEARAWLMARMNASTRAWFLKHEKELLAAIAASDGKIRVSQAKVLKPNLGLGSG